MDYEYDSDDTVIDTDVAPDVVNASMFLEIPGKGLFLKTQITYDMAYKVFANEDDWDMRKGYLNNAMNQAMTMDFEAEFAKDFNGQPLRRLLLHRVDQWNSKAVKISTLQDYVIQHGRMDHYLYLDIFPHIVNVIVGTTADGYEVVCLGTGKGDRSAAPWCHWDGAQYVVLERHFNGAMHPLRRMEFSPMSPARTCNCRDDAGGACYIDQHFFAKDDRFCVGRTNLLAGVTQGMKSRQGVAAMALGHYENGLLPVLVTRNVRCDAEATWTSSIHSFNAWAGKELRIVPYYETNHVERHINDGKDGIPLLIVLYNNTGLGKIKELWKHGLVGAVAGRYRRFHLVVDEADVTVQTAGASSATEKTLWSGGKNSIFNTAAVVTWITATPIALFVNSRHMGTRVEEAVRSYGLDVVDQYYRFDEQDLGAVPGREIRYGWYDAFTDKDIYQIVIGDMMAGSGARRCLVTSADVATTVRQVEKAKLIAGMYDKRGTKTVVSIAWQANQLTVFFGGKDALGCLEAFKRTETAAKQRDGFLVVRGNINCIYDSLHGIFGTDKESEGPDIVVVAKDMADRGVRFETTAHRWILTDLLIDKMTATWSIEAIVQIVGRINGVSALDVTKCLWTRPENIDQIRAALTVNSTFMKILVEENYQRFRDFLYSSFQGIMNVLESENPTLTGVQRAVVRQMVRGLRASRTRVCSSATTQLKRYRDDMDKTVKRHKLEDGVLRMETLAPEMVNVADSANAAENPDGYVPLVSGEAFFVTIWQRKETEAAFRAIASHFEGARRPTGAEKIAVLLIEHGIVKNKAKAKELLRIGTKRDDIVPWMGKTGKEGAWMTTNGRGWVFNNDTNQPVAMGRGGNLDVWQEIERHFDVGQEFTYDDLRQLEIGAQIDASHRAPIWNLVKIGKLERCKPGHYRRLV